MISYHCCLFLTFEPLIFSYICSWLCVVCEGKDERVKPVLQQNYQIRIFYFLVDEK